MSESHQSSDITTELTEAQSTEVWNNLPFETRKALAVHWRHTQIRYLESEKRELRNMVERRCREVDDQINNIRRGIRNG